jgi:hypothetical protein
MKALIAIGKLALTGAIIAGLAFFVFAQSPEDGSLDVKEAEADIGWFSAGDDGHNFTRAIVKAGMKPRPYDLNGNRMYFASGRTEMKPAEVESTMQDIFVEEGVNEKNHTGRQPMEQAALLGDLQSPEGRANLAQENTETGELFMDGEVMPVQRRRGYVAMAGYDWKMSEEDMIDRISAGKMSAREFHPDNMITGYKFVDATWEPASRMTSVTSVWTGDDFKAERMHDEGFKKQTPDPNVPACIGCERDFRFQSLAKDEPVRANKWRTNASVEETYRFYSKAMHQRGWSANRSDDVLQELATRLPSVGAISGRLLHLEKDGKVMTIAMVPDGRGGTEVMSNERYEGAASVFQAAENIEKESKKEGFFSGILD